MSAIGVNIRGQNTNPIAPAPYPVKMTLNGGQQNLLEWSARVTVSGSTSGSSLRLPQNPEDGTTIYFQNLASIPWSLIPASGTIGDGSSYSVGVGVDFVVQYNVPSATWTINASANFAASDLRYQPNLAQKSQTIQAALALAAQKQGTSYLDVIFVGDSITAGTGNTTFAPSPPQGSFATKLISEMIGRAGWVATHGVQVLVPQNLISTPDARLDVGSSNWTRGGLGWGDGSTFRAAGNVADQVAVWSPGTESWDTCYVDVYTASGLGTLVVTPSGGTPVTYSCGTTTGWHRITASASSLLDSNTIELKMLGSVGPDYGVYVTGITTFNSAIKQVRIGNVGRPNALSADLNNATAFGTLDLITNYNAGLYVVMIGTNDMIQGVPLATTQANIQAIITRCLTVGSCILMTPPPSSDATVMAATTAYNAMLYGLAKTNNIPLIDLYSAMGSTYQSAWMGDSVHLNNAGDWFTASLLGTEFAGIF